MTTYDTLEQLEDAYIEMRYLRAEIERLLAALRDIDTLTVNHEAASLRMAQQIARAALKVNHG